MKLRRGLYTLWRDRPRTGYFEEAKLFELSPLSIRANLWDFQSQSVKKLPTHPASEKEKTLTN